MEEQQERRLTPLQALHRSITSDPVLDTFKPLCDGDETRLKHFVAGLVAYLKRDEMNNGARCLANSAPAGEIMNAAREALDLGLNFNAAMPEAYLVRYKRNVQLVPSYGGLIALAMRAGIVKSVDARLVYEGDVMHDVGGSSPSFSVEHRHETTDEARVTHVYAVAHLHSGGYKHEVMSREQIERVQRASKTQMVWGPHWGEMARKTVIRRLMKTLDLRGDSKLLRAIDVGDQAERVEDAEVIEPQQGTVDALKQRHVKQDDEQDSNQGGEERDLWDLEDEQKGE